MSQLTERFLQLSAVSSWMHGFIRYWPPKFNIKGNRLSLVSWNKFYFIGYFCLMDNLYDLPDRDISQPKWLADFVQEHFARYFHRYEGDSDFTDYIHPILPDGATEYLFNSQLAEIFQIQTSDEIYQVEEYLRSIDLLQREYLPSEHLKCLRFLVSFLYFYIFLVRMII